MPARTCIGLRTSTIIFTVCLCAVFLFWWLRERTLSVHSIDTTRRELFYWAAILLTRPLGASTGDLLSQTSKDGGLALGTTVTRFIFLAVIVSLVTYLTITRRDDIAWDDRRDDVMEEAA